MKTLSVGNTPRIFLASTRPTRHGFVLFFTLLTSPAQESDAVDVSVIQVDHGNLVAQSDLVYLSPCEKPNEGQPVGNGHMGSLVWTTPRSINFQINRVDVFALNKHHLVAIPNKGSGSDYCGGCAAVSVDLGGDVFVANRNFRHTLSLYDAESRVDSKDVTARCFVSALEDVLVLEIDDKRDTPRAIRCEISHWRKPEVITTDPDTKAQHVAKYSIESRDGRIILEQHFDEAFSPEFKRENYHCRSAVAVEVLGEGVVTESPGKRKCTVIAPARRGKRTILISSDASFSPGDEVSKSALTHLARLAKQSYDVLRSRHIAWWHGFWNRGSFVHVDPTLCSAREAQAARYSIARFLERCALYSFTTWQALPAVPPRPSGTLPCFQRVETNDSGDHNSGSGRPSLSIGWYMPPTLRIWRIPSFACT